MKWWLDPKELDYKYYLPIFLEGLREKEEPYQFLAENGTIGMIVQGKDKIRDVLPDLIFPLKSILFGNHWYNSLLCSAPEFHLLRKNISKRTF